MSDVTVRDNSEASRYEAVLDGEVVGLADYRLDGTTMEITHTETDAGHQGQGIAGEVVRTALDAAREAGLKVIPTCPYVENWIAEHPEYQELLAEKG
ncbi:GNAT family N-acetyltransferase [Kytococcus sedentarius]|uniref:GNAT family N-acetyltransferase n=1 Tax=Kytococcus sedentarius TaxID=1276 RepID=UPI0035BBA155